ncbi:hypothetical protein K7X08_021178 [Anisodus acutangulus]|uniref:Anaphase-promoting complex subunit 2 n=1 Tax=Anisodus acutangulus TaxID=402998 RepID=A0A9Q1M3U9_9SOLA|nr:hypothetical protein K7X08_021178 [Anisodus acutangulus]
MGFSTQHENGGNTVDISENWNSFCSTSESLLKGNGDLSFSTEFIMRAKNLSKHGLASLIEQHFLRPIEETFERNGARRFWSYFEPYRNAAPFEINKDPILEEEIQQVICKALEEISSENQFQEKCLLLLAHALQSYEEDKLQGQANPDSTQVYLFSKYQLIVSSVLLASLPHHFPGILHWYFKGRLEELSTIAAANSEDEDELDMDDKMDLDEKRKLPFKCGNMDSDINHKYAIFSDNNKLVKNIGMVVRDLRNIGFTSMAEDAYASAIFFLLKEKVHDLAGNDYSSSVLESIKAWIQHFLDYLSDFTSCDGPSSGLKSPLASHPSLCYSGTGVPSEGLVRWQLRLDALAIEDLKQCLEYTGQHSNLVDSFISSLRYRLLTAGASTNDILHQYISTIKALRTIVPAGVFLEAVGEPTREYLRRRKDTIKCIVTMLTNGTGGNPNGSGSSGDSLLGELNRDEESQENTIVDDDINSDNKQAWINAQNWEPDPVEADPSKGSRYRRKVDILGMIVGIIGSKDQLVNEYRVILAEKLLNKSDYDIDAEIRTLELLKVLSLTLLSFADNDLIDSKRTNTNIKPTIKHQPQPEQKDLDVSLDNLNATIISSNFWPPFRYTFILLLIQSFYLPSIDEAVNLPEHVEQLLTDYAKRYTEIKTPRKLIWKINLGSVKLELQFEDRAVQFNVTPLRASIIMQFQDQKKWTSKNLAAAVGVPVNVLNRRINFWISKGVLVESMGTDSADHAFTLVETMNDTGKSGTIDGGCEELLAGDEDGERSVASVEDQLRKEMTVYEKFIMGMLTNFGSMALNRIHNTLKMYCIADPTYDKSLQKLQSFLSGLVAEEKLEFRDGMYFLRK